MLGSRRPGAVGTLFSALLGSDSHVLIDGFTHAGRFGANWLGINEVLFTAPVRGDMTGARVLQYVGHFGGSAAFIAALLVVASSGLLNVWYGQQAVADARASDLSGRERFVFWAMVVAFTALAGVSAAVTDRSVIFVPVTTLVVVLLVAGVLLGRPDREPSPSLLGKLNRITIRQTRGSATPTPPTLTVQPSRLWPQRAVRDLLGLRGSFGAVGLSDAYVPF
ncbi:MAG: DUF4184 family protein [Acidimicrobiales bacterium]